MKIRIIQVGADKDSFVKEAVAKFKKLLSGYCELEITEVKEARESKTFGPEMCKAEEGEALLKILSKSSNNSKIWLLDEKGEEFTSRGFAGEIQKTQDSGDCLIFVIGGAFGLDEKIKSEAYKKLSFSKMTFTHQMIRIFLLEQLYRGFCIIQGKEYHND